MVAGGAGGLRCRLRFFGRGASGAGGAGGGYFFMRAAWAAARRAMGTRKGEQLT